MNIIEKIENEHIENIGKTIPDFASGDTIRVGYKITEGERTRIQNYEGVVISRKGGSTLAASFTVRKISFGEGVERTFPLFGTVIDTIKVIRSGKVRRAKLYYLRDRTGKSARIAEKIRKKIGIDIEVKPETVTEENLAPVTLKQEDETEAPKAEVKKEETPKVEAKKEEAPKAEAKKEVESSTEKK